MWHCQSKGSLTNPEYVGGMAGFNSRVRVPILQESVILLGLNESSRSTNNLAVILGVSPIKVNHGESFTRFMETVSLLDLG